MFRWFKKKPERQTITEKVVLGNGTEINKVYDITFDPEKVLKEILTMAKDPYPFKTIMAALDAVQTRLNNIECRVMDLDKKVEDHLDSLWSYRKEADTKPMRKKKADKVGAKE